MSPLPLRVLVRVDLFVLDRLRTAGRDVVCRNEKYGEVFPGLRASFNAWGDVYPRSVWTWDGPSEFEL